MNTQLTASVAVLILGLALVATEVVAEDETVIKVSAGIEQTSGDYGGTETIEDLYTVMRADFDFGKIGFRLTVPYLSVTAPEGTIISDPDSEPVPGSGANLTESGIGDMVASLTVFDVFRSPDTGIAFDITGKVKFGTADRDKGLGTGENDYSVQGDLYKFLDRYVLVGTAGYKLRGDPTDIDLENVFFGSAGAICRCARRTRIGLFYDFRQSALVGGESIREISGVLSQRLSKSLQLQVYAFTGLTDSSPDWGGGVALTMEIG